MQSNLPETNNKSNINNNINKNPIGIYETALMQSNIPEANNNMNYNNNINKNPIGVYETALMQSNMEGSKISQMSSEPKPSEFNIMNEKNTMGFNSNVSFPTQSHSGKTITQTNLPKNPFQSK